MHTGVSEGKPKGKRPFGSTRYKWDINIQMNAKENCWDDKLG